MIYTVTLNPAIDKTVVIDNFEAGKVNRIKELRKDPGGKGLNVSKTVKALSGHSAALCITGGRSGDELLALADGLTDEIICVRCLGETRTNLKITDPALHTVTDINEPGPVVGADTLDELKNRLLDRVLPGDTVVLSGSLPAGAAASLYYDWTLSLKSAGAGVILDADGDALRLGINAAPLLIKPNDTELCRLLGKELSGMNELCDAAAELRDRGIENVVISLGEKGALFAFGGDIYVADAPKVPVISTVGAGDALVAALAYAIDTGISNEETCRLAIAASAAKVMCSGSQPPEPDIIERLLPEVIIKRL